MKEKRVTLAVFTCSSVFLSLGICWAGEQVGTLTELQGTVKLFSHPSKTLQKEEGAPHALFEGEYFLVSDAKTGDRLEKGNILRTSPGAKARVIYDNGDQMNVGSSTAYRITWNKDSAKANTEILLAYGKLRGIVEKGGPRSHLKVKTKSAVMGVRGTDFFIALGGSDEATEVTIIRGSVEVAPTVAKKESGTQKVTPQAAKPIEVKAGFSAEIKPPQPVQHPTGREIANEDAKQVGAQTNPVNPEMELRKTTQEEFVGIQKSSTIEASNAKKPADKEVEKKVEALEKKASITTLKDIQTHDAKLYAALTEKKEGGVSVDDVNKAAISNLIKDAPKAPPQHKPYKSEMEDIDDGAYTKYFKNVN